LKLHAGEARLDLFTDLSEQHPREQGLKLGIWKASVPGATLSEQHPREQGLKLHSLTRLKPMTFSAFRATSKRTRIETILVSSKGDPGIVFQSNIQENKD